MILTPVTFFGALSLRSTKPVIQLAALTPAKRDSAYDYTLSNLYKLALREGVLHLSNAIPCIVPYNHCVI